MILSETGSGKTLAYLLPVLNKIYHTRDQIENEKITLDGRQINLTHSQNSRPRRLSLKQSKSLTPKGALILTSNSHLLYQIELLVSDLDYKNKLNIAFEDGSSSMPTNFITYDIILCTPSRCNFCSLTIIYSV